MATNYEGPNAGYPALQNNANAPPAYAPDGAQAAAAPVYAQPAASPQIVYVQGQAPPANTMVQPAVVQGQQPVVIMQQPPTGQQPTQIVYVQQQPVADGQPTTMATNGQPVQTVVVAGGVVNGGLAPGYAKQTNVGDHITFFRRKMNEHTQQCCCCQCCSLWVGTIIWLVLFIIGNGLTVIFMIVALAVGFVHIYTILQFIASLIELGVNIYCFYGLYNCVPLAFLLQILAIIFGIIMSIVSIAIGGDPSFIGSILLALWALYVFWRGWNWAKFYKNGGDYDPNMMRPIPNSN